jgi:hypothetical protein
LASALRNEFARLAGEPFAPGMSDRFDEMIYRAARGEYGTFPGISILRTSKCNLLEDCIASGLNEFEERVKQCEFDETAEERLLAENYIQNRMLSDAKAREYKKAHRWDIEKPKFY